MSVVKGFLNALQKDVKLGIRALVLALSGLITGLTVAFPQIGFLSWLTIVPAGIILIKRASSSQTKLRSAYFDGLVFFYFYYLVCYHFFLSMYPLDFIDGVNNATAAAVVVIAWFGLALLQALFGGFVFLLCALLFRGRICQRVALLKPVAIAAIWAIFEWSQNFGWWGVPWGRLPLSQTHYIVGIQNASWLGSYFLTFVIVLVNFSIALLLLEANKERIVKATAILAVSVITFQYASGALIWFLTDNEEGDTTRIACIQGNISASNKWTVDTFDQIQTVYWNETRKAAKEGAEIVVWPETAIPFNITRMIYSGYDDMCKELAKETGVYILVGAYSTEGENNYNSLLCYTPEGERLGTAYHKRRLVPFGEFVPMRELVTFIFPPLANIGMLEDDLVAGDDSYVIDSEIGNIGCGLCFDSIYEGVVLGAVRNGAEIVVISTNDSWFSDSAALDMHNGQARLRAIESGKYVVRSANTGISSIIDPLGNVKTELGALERGYVVSEVSPRGENTIYAYIGNTFAYICIAYAIGMICLSVIEGFKKRVIKKS